MSDQQPFILHERLQADTHEIIRLVLCRVLLMNDAAVPWLILVPERPGISEIHELSPDDRALLIEEVSYASDAVQRLYGPDKINIGALGNIVSQLHIHVIGRYRYDRAWPGPMWGTGPAKAYTPAEASAICARVRAALGTD